MTTSAPRNGSSTATAIEPEELLFPAGILGFEDCRRYILIGDESTYPSWALQSTEDPWVSFTLIDPTAVFPDYVATLSPADRKLLAADADAELLVLCIISVPENPEEMTGNLLAPVVINPKARLGKQIILQDSAYSVRQRLFPKPGHIEP